MTESKKLKEVKLVYYNQQKTLSNSHRKIDRIIKIEHVMCTIIEKIDCNGSVQRKYIQCPRQPRASSLRVRSPIWASEVSLARTREHSRETCFTRPNRRACSQATGLVDFAIVLVNYSASVQNIVLVPDRQVTFFEEFKLQKNCESNSAHQKVFGAS